MDSLSGRTILMSGGSRGIGLAIAVRAARDGARVALIAKTAEPHPKLPGTIYTAAEEIEAAGGEALPAGEALRPDAADQLARDVRRDARVPSAPARVLACARPDPVATALGRSALA